MKVEARYRVHQHCKFEQAGRKYAADLESDTIVEINNVEWELLDRDLTETLYATVEALKLQFKIEQIFEGIERLQWLSQRGQLLSPTWSTYTPSQSDRRLKLLVPFQFIPEKSFQDPVTNENRFHLLVALSKLAELETFNINGEPEHDFGGFVSNRNINAEEHSNFWFPWYAMDGYDGILLLGQFPNHDILYYSKNLPVLRCLESDRRMQASILESALNSYTAQKSTDLILSKATWLTDWLSEFGVDSTGVHTISEGIGVAEPIGKELAKQHTAVLTDNPLFAQRPVVGIISGFEPNAGMRNILDIATANPHLVFFVYDSILADTYQNSLSNLVIFNASDESTRSVLPIFFQALDVVCFPAVPGTSPSLVLEAMAYGTPAVVISKYGLPPEIEGAGVLVQGTAGKGNDLEVPMQHLSETINQLLSDTERCEKYREVAKGFVAKYTWERTAQEIVRLFKQGSVPADTRCQSSTPLSLCQPLFCRYYDPRTGIAYPSVYRQETNRFERLENALAEVLFKYHTPAEVESVFKHFQRDSSLAGNGLNPSG